MSAGLHNVTGWRAAWVNHRFVVLLVALLLTIVTTPMAQAFGAEGAAAHIVVSVTFGVLVLSAALAVSSSRVDAVIATALAVPTLISEIVHALSGSDYRFQAARDAIAIAFLAYVSLLVLRYLFSSSRVTVNVICASLCIYLLMAVIWAIVYSLIEALRPGSFEINTPGAAMRFGGGDAVLPLYYSLVTLTTVGYGDIVPASSTARMLAAIEAVVGQIYLAVLVARLVGIHVAQKAAGN